MRDPALPLHAQTEAERTLTSLAYRKTGAIPALVLARHVLAVTAEADWAVRRAAMEAILRRCSFARRDDLRVARRPPGGAATGAYTTRRGRSRERPYATTLDGIDPLSASCECPDFLRGSLGVCKHVLSVLEDLASSRARWKRAGRADGIPPEAPRLEWDPIRPLTGPGDPLERLQLRAPHVDPRVRSLVDGVRRWFRPGPDGTWRLRAVGAEPPARRLEMVEDLLSLTLPTGSRRRVVSAQPAVPALLRQEREHLQRACDAQEAAPGLRQALRGLKRKLYPYQMQGVLRFLASGRLLLADDMGLGKTAQAIGASHALFVTKRARRGLVIAPASLKEQWRREWTLFSDTPILVVDGSAEERRRAYARHRHGFLIANYEQILRDLSPITAWGPDLIILDEAQRIKNWATKTAACVKELRPAYRLVLTGTPMENRLEELASIVEWVDDHALEPKWRLSPFHSVSGDGQKEGARHLDTLRARLAGCMLRRRRSEVLSQLPGRTDTIVPVAITDEQADEHASLDRPIATLVRTANKRPLTQAEFLKLMTLFTMQRIIANGMAQLRFAEVWPSVSRLQPDATVLASLAAPKLGELREIVSQIAVEQGRRMVVFSQWRRMLALANWAVEPILRAAGLRAAFFTGAEGPRRRTRSLVDFHDDPATRVLFATDAGGVGLNLQHAANCCVNVELPWNPAVLEQRIGRIHRMGQRRPIDVYNLVTLDSIEARIAALVSDKRALFRGLFDSDSNEVRFERSASFLARIHEITAPARPVVRPAAAETDDEPESVLAPAADAAVADESRDIVEPAAQALAPPTADGIRRVFASLDIRPLPNGHLHIDAPPEAATMLAALFEGMANLLRRAADTPERQREEANGT